MQNLLDSPFFGNAPYLWAIAAALFIGVVGATALTRSFLLARLGPADGAPAAMSWRSVLYQLARRTLLIVAILVGAYLGAQVLSLHRTVEQTIDTLVMVALFVQGALWADQLMGAAAEWQLSRHRATHSASRNAVGIIRFLLRVGVWTVAFLLILANLGFDVTALVAGLGIGGVAVALAAQNILGDLFASIAIVLDRPFEVGDFIAFGDQQGRVERIGIKTTRLRSLSGEQIAIANSVLLANRIHNFRRMSERRVSFVIGIGYETPYHQVERVPELIREVICAQSNVRFQRAHFQAYGQNSLIFEVVYGVMTRDYDAYMDVQQAINLAMLRRFAEEGIAFAHPGRVPSLPTLRPELPGDSRGNEARQPRRVRSPADV